MEQLQVRVRCPFCRQSLMDKGKEIDGYPSIKTVIQYGNNVGILHLSSIYGSYNIDSGIHVPLNETVIFFCPYCHSSLLADKLCERCSAPVALFELQNGGRVEICSRRGCKEHFIEFSNLSQKISSLYGIHETLANPLEKK